MKRKIASAFLLSVLAIIFTIALTFASIEFPKLTDDLIHDSIDFVNVYTGGGEYQELKTDYFISHYHIRTIGYISLGVIALMIILGFITERTGWSSLGAFAVFLPVFGHFAATMFFLGGLGFLRIIWLPGLDLSFDIMKLGDAVFIPYRLIIDLFNLAGINLNDILPYIFTAAGLMIFCIGTLQWFFAYFKKIGLAKKGLYKISRHPQYLGWIIWSYGIIFLPGANMKQSYSISDSLPWLISTLIIIGVAMLEEIKMSRRYGEQYDQYRKSTFFMIPFPKYLCRIISAPFRVFFNKNYPTRKREIISVLGFYFVLLVTLTALLNSAARTTAPGRWEFAETDKRNLTELSKAFIETSNRREKYKISKIMIDKGTAAVPYFIDLIGNPDPVVREFSADALGIIKSNSAISVLLNSLSDKNIKVVYSVLRSLGNYRSEAAVNRLIESLNSGNPQLIPLIAGALVRIGTQSAVNAVIPLAEKDIIDPNTDLILALSKYPNANAERLILRYMTYDDVKIRRAAVIASRNFPSADIKKTLIKMEADEDMEVRIFAAETLERINM
jgi:hypothetical protein